MPAPSARHLSTLGRTPVRLRPLAGLCALAALVLAVAPASAATFVFESNFFQFDATGPASGTLETAPGTGGPGDQILLSDIVFFEFSHTFAPGTTILFDTNDLVAITGVDGLNVSPDGSGLESGGWTAVNADGRRMRHVNNAGDLNDNYLVDSNASTADGAFGGAFGGWVLVPEPGAGLLFGLGLAFLPRRRGAARS